MDAQTCLKKLGYVGVLSFATTDGEGNPQVRNISAIHYEPDAIYFFTARGRLRAVILWQSSRYVLFPDNRYFLAFMDAFCRR